jgi:hypothetical protein
MDAQICLLCCVVPVQARLIVRLLVNHSPLRQCASVIRCRIMPYSIKAARYAAPLARRQRRCSALGCPLGVALRKTGQLEEAITAHRDAAAIMRETGEGHGDAIALTNIELDRATQRLAERPTSMATPPPTCSGEVTAGRAPLATGGSAR